jgi:hypothetical protein
LLVFFTFLFMVAAWRYVRSGRLGWCLLAGGALGLMHATKETFVFALAAMAGAVVLTRFWNHGLYGGSAVGTREKAGRGLSCRGFANDGWVVTGRLGAVELGPFDGRSGGGVGGERVVFQFVLHERIGTRRFGSDLSAVAGSRAGRESACASMALL